MGAIVGVVSHGSAVVTRDTCVSDSISSGDCGLLRKCHRTGLRGDGGCSLHCVSLLCNSWSSVAGAGVRFEKAVRGTEILWILVHSVRELVCQVADEGTEPRGIGTTYERRRHGLVSGNRHTFGVRPLVAILVDFGYELNIAYDSPAVILDGVDQPSEHIHVFVHRLVLRLAQVNEVRRRVQ